MYIVEIKNDNITTTIHGEREKLKSGNVVKGINCIDSFSFTILPSNAGFDLLFDRKTLVTVYNTNKNKYVFHGRVLHSHDAMDSSGLISKEVTCESYFGFLCDSKQTYIEERNWTVSELFNHIIEVHNNQVEDYKRFEVGDLFNATEEVYIGIQRENTWKTIEEKLINKLGGEVRFVVEDDVDDVIYIDYLESFGETLSTEIALSKNMKTITKENDPTAYISRLIPLGCKLTKIVDGEEVETEERLDITSVNDGVDYIEDSEALEVYGIRVEHVLFDDVTEASNLLTKGQQYLINNNKVQVKYSITALDLSLLGLDIDDFEIYNYHPINNSLLGIDDVARVVKEKLDVCEETKSTIEVGDNFKTLSDIQREQAGRLENLSYLTNTIQTTQNNLKNNVSSVGSNVTDLKEVIREQTTTLTNTCESIILEALSSYTEKGDFESFQETIASQLQILADSISLNFTETTKELEAINGDLQEKYNTITSYFRFDIDGLTIGKTDNPYVVEISNDRYSMKVNGVEVLWIDAISGQVHTPELTVTRKFDLFGYLINQDDNGNVNCEYGGDE